jgi:hypothetical protein
MVMPLTLRPIAYIVEDVGSDNERRRREVLFGTHGRQMEFEVAYLQNASAVFSGRKTIRGSGWRTTSFGSPWMDSTL